MDKAQEAAREIVNLISKKDHGKIQDKIFAFKGDREFNRFTVIRLLISHAQVTNNYELARHALDAFESVKSKAPTDAGLYYDIANGYQVLYDTTINEAPEKAFQCEGVIKEAIKYFTKASELEPQTYTNLGNLYDRIWRPVEAIDSYEAALALKKDFGMAYGNKAITLIGLARYSGHETIYMIKAYQLMQLALKNEDSIKEYGEDWAITHFRERAEKIEQAFKAAGREIDLTADLQHSQYDASEYSGLAAFYTKFCIENNLYLNLHLSDQASDASIGDNLFPTLYTKPGQDEKKYVNDIAFRFNEISESFMVARLALVQSQNTNDEFTSISKQTLLIDNEDESRSNVYVGYLKTAYKEAFSTLDKIAVLINHYLDLGHLEDSVYYGNVWFVPKERGDDTPSVISDKIKNEPGLLGLYLICNDLRGSKYSHLRNALTHRYARIYVSKKAPKGAYTFDDLSTTTVDVFYKIRCCIMYLSLFIARKELYKHLENKSTDKSKAFTITMNIPNDQHLDSWD